MTSLNNLELHYADFGGNTIVGRGEYICLFLEDAAIPFEYVRIPLPQWTSEVKNSLIEQGHDLLRCNSKI